MNRCELQCALPKLIPLLFFSSPDGEHNTNRNPEPAPAPTCGPSTSSRVLMDTSLHSAGLTPVGDYMETCTEAVPDAVLVLFLGDVPVAHPDPVALLEELPSRLLAPSWAGNRLRSRPSIRPPVHQHLRGDHVYQFFEKFKKSRNTSTSSLFCSPFARRKKSDPPPKIEPKHEENRVLSWQRRPTGWFHQRHCRFFFYLILSSWWGMFSELKANPFPIRILERKLL